MNVVVVALLLVVVVIVSSHDGWLWSVCACDVIGRRDVGCEAYIYVDCYCCRGRCGRDGWLVLGGGHCWLVCWIGIVVCRGHRWVWLIFILRDTEGEGII
jgi:hypothetical protein